MSDTKEISPVESPSDPSPAPQPDVRKTRRTHAAAEGEIHAESSTAVSISNEQSVSSIENLSATSLYLNRELTWLEFNRRVLHEALDERTPLLERIKFLSIVSSNLDEFFMKRIGGLKQQLGAGIRSLTVDGRNPRRQIEECHAVVRDIEERKLNLLPKLLGLLGARGISILSYADLTAAEKKHLRDYYFRNIFPLITPQSVDPAHPFPFISNLSLNLLVTLRYPRDKEVSLARVKAPVGSGAGKPRIPYHACG